MTGEATADSGGGGFLLIVGIVIIFYFIFTYNWKRSKAKRAFRQIPFSKIEDVQDGDFVKIKGTVWDGGERITAPLSERQCVYYHVEVLERSGGRDRTWSTILEEEVMADVVLKSGDYYAVIQADSPLAHLMMDKHYESGFWNDPNENVIKFLRKHGQDPDNFLGMNRTLECKEGILKRGEEFAVTGCAKWIPATELKFKIPAERVLLIYETEQDEVVLSEDPSLVKPELFRHKKL